jgi:hypothetical protein
MYSTSAVILATIQALRTRGFSEAAASGKDSESIARKQMMFTAIRSLTAQTPCTTVALLGLNASAAKSYEERDKTFWRNEKERDEWIDEVRKLVISVAPEASAKPQESDA